MKSEFNSLVVSLTAIWLALVMKWFLWAVLVYFLALKPLAGSGYGLAYSLFYIVIFCPIAAILLRPYLLRKRAEKRRAEEEKGKLQRIS